MKSRIVQLAALCSAILFCLGALAHADPVVITAGTYSAPGFDPASFDFFGDGFDLHGEGTPVGVGPVMTCVQCAPGAMINLGAAISLPDQYTTGVTGPNTAVIGGNTYSNVFYAGNLLFNAPTVVAPPNTGTGVTLTDPFTFSGVLAGFPTSDRNTTPLFSLNLTGTGTVQFSILSTSNGYDYGDTFYRFSASSPSPTPEPAALILLGTGLLAVLARRFVITA